MSLPDSAGPSNPWFIRFQERPQATIRLYCLPHAGGGASTFRSWAAELPESIEVVAVQLPGRESRLRESLPGRIDELVQPLAVEIDRLSDLPFACFGHSLGAVLSFELVRHQRRHGLALPTQLIVSGRNAPQLDSSHDKTFRHEMSDAELIDELRRLQGTPEEILENREFMAALLPVIRGDFKLVERYQYVEEPPLPVPLLAFAATEDKFTTRSGVEAWRQQSDISFRSKFFPGDHFFFISRPKPVWQTVGGQLLRNQ